MRMQQLKIEYGLDDLDAEGNLIALFVTVDGEWDETQTESLSLWDAWQRVKGQPLDGDPRTERCYEQLQEIFAPVDQTPIYEGRHLRVYDYNREATFAFIADVDYLDQLPPLELMETLARQRKRLTVKIYAEDV